jgi:hypothetical protein
MKDILERLIRQRDDLLGVISGLLNAINADGLYREGVADFDAALSRAMQKHGCIDITTWDAREALATLRSALPTTSDGIARLVVQRDELVNALQSAINQVEYLHRKFQETGSGNGLIAQWQQIISNATDHFAGAGKPINTETINISKTDSN